MQFYKGNLTDALGQIYPEIEFDADKFITLPSMLIVEFRNN